jgi:hypothetical protein
LLMLEQFRQSLRGGTRLHCWTARFVPADE